MKKFYDKKGFGLFVGLIVSVVAIVLSWFIITPVAVMQKGIFVTPTTQILALISLVGIVSIIWVTDLIVIYKDTHDNSLFVK